MRVSVDKAPVPAGDSLVRLICFEPLLFSQKRHQILPDLLISEFLSVIRASIIVPNESNKLEFPPLYTRFALL